MPVTAKLHYLHIAPRKVRLVVDLIRRKKVQEAQIILNFAKKRACLPVMKLLNQAIANAKNNFQLDPENLYISKIVVDEGPKMKTWRARARGQAYEIQKKTSHIEIVLDEIVKGSKKIKTDKTKEAEIFQKVEKGEKKIKIVKPKMNRVKESLKPTTDKNVNKMFRRKSI